MTPPVGRAWNSGMMSSIRQDWATPRVLFEMLDHEFHFTLDVCADPSNAKCEEWFGCTGLERSWKPIEIGAIWCNPPYKDVGKWVEKALRESRGGLTVVLLIPARTDTKWFHDYCLKGEIRFLRGRLNFDETRLARAPFPSMVVVFSPQEPGTANAQPASHDTPLEAK